MRTDADSFNGNDDYTPFEYLVECQRPCDDKSCGKRHLHVFTDAELRARDERIIDAAYQWAVDEWGSIPHQANTDIDAIIAAAEADQ